MLPFRFLSIEGQELNQEDVNAISAYASGSGNLVLQELLRPTFANGGAPKRFILPTGTFGGAGFDASSTVIASGEANGKISIAPFRAVLGPLDADSLTNPGYANWAPIHTVLCVDNTTPGSGLLTQIQLAPTVANPRCDLVYVKITLSANNLTDNRYVRDPVTEAVNSQSILVETVDKYEILVETGTEAPVALPPATPADSGLSFVIPLAYVFVNHPFTTTSVVDSRLVWEIAPVIPASRSLSVATCRPASAQWDPDGDMIAAIPFFSIAPPITYMASTMVGKEELLLAWDWDSSNPNPPVGSTIVVDNRVDWRNRAFKWTAFAQNGTTSARFPWQNQTPTNPGTVPSVVTSTLGTTMSVGAGQSWWDDGTANSFGFAGGSVAVLSSGTNVGHVANTIWLYVDLTTGELKVKTIANPDCRVFLWLEATAPFRNR